MGVRASISVLEDAENFVEQTTLTLVQWCFIAPVWEGIFTILYLYHYEAYFCL